MAVCLEKWSLLKGLKMSNPIYEYEKEILEQHLDTFGHVNNAVYLSLYEEARWDFITKNGLGLKQILESKVGPVLLDLNLTFKSELNNREKIKIISQARPEMRNKFVMVLDQKMLKENGKVASTLTLSVGLMDLNLRKLVSPTKEWLLALGLNEINESV
jgi:acyl-CoA thioester hydrolase